MIYFLLFWYWFSAGLAAYRTSSLDGWKDTVWRFATGWFFLPSILFMRILL